MAENSSQGIVGARITAVRRLTESEARKFGLAGLPFVSVLSNEYLMVPATDGIRICDLLTGEVRTLVVG